MVVENVENEFIENPHDTFPVHAGMLKLDAQQGKQRGTPAPTPVKTDLNYGRCCQNKITTK